MGVFAQSSGHEQVIFCHDSASGLRAIIAIYSTALGPGLGGTRFYPYADEEAALADVLDLSRAMAYKNAVAGLAHGGGKAVILGDPATDKTPEKLRAYGRFVASPLARWVTATVHPSSILRQRTDEERERAMASFIDDLRRVRDVLDRD